MPVAIDTQAQPPPAGSDAEAFTPPSVSHVPNVAYLIGHPIAHSSSPALHDSISATSEFPYAQVLVETKDLLSSLRYLRDHPSTPRLLGSGVTMPHKVAVIPHLDDLTDEAKAVGAVNTIFFRRNDIKDGPLRFTGHNTDTIGIRDAFRFNVSSETLNSCRGRPGLIVGGGGTCRAAIYALQQFLGCSKIYIVNRDASEVEAVLKECRARNAAEHLVHVATLDQAEGLEAPGLIVSAVPDFEPKTPEEKTARAILSSFLNQQQQQGLKGGLVEMCYHPSPDTHISRMAAEAGWKVIGGIEAMIGQGLEQSKLWTGIEVTEKLRDAARKAVRPKH
ncbi:Quinate dehydrogenase [Cyphellophora attinorum]|uniref:Quinate dehydrogenase n=1 Tax=Cyphellophora attinorum TaxID=1664694 RepID=A0A0N1H354_9EURO|nr:Quinate dehydrogenase [Phialophora attinorum]KPI35163.1 Quinate dehydrogenase [Phialophora attinorum]